MIRHAFKRLLRDRSMWIGYLSVFVLFFLTSFYPIGLMEAGAIVIRNVEEKSPLHRLEDGYFESYTPLTKTSIARLEEGGTIIEAHFSLDTRLEDGSVLRITTPRETIDIPYIAEGDLPKRGQIAPERNYAALRQLKVGDPFKLGDETYTISGFTALPDYEECLKNVSDTSADGKSFGHALLDPEDYAAFKAGGNGLQAESLTYAFILGKDVREEDFKEKLLEMKLPLAEVSDEVYAAYVQEKRRDIDEVLERMDHLDEGTRAYDEAIRRFSEGSEQFKTNFALLPLPKFMKEDARDYFDGVAVLEEESLKFTEGLSGFTAATRERITKEFPAEVPNLAFYLGRDDNPRIFAGLDDSAVDTGIARPASILSIILCSYAITVLIGHVMEKEKPVIGTLAALGVRKRSIILSYTIGPVLLVAFAGFLGILGAKYYNIQDNLSEKAAYYSLPNLDIPWTADMFVFGLIYPVCITFGISVLFVHRKLKQSVLSLIRNESVVKVRKRKVDLTEMNFGKKFRIKYLLGEIRSVGISLIAILLSLWIMCLAVHINIYCTRIRDIPKDLRYEHMYGFTYPSAVLPPGGESAYMKSLTKKFGEYTFQVNLLGIEEDSAYFPRITVQGKKEIAVSKPVAVKFKLRTGDPFLLSDSVRDLDYVFTVGEVIDYEYGMEVFMPIEYASELFGDPGERNLIFSDEALDIPEDVLLFHLEKGDMIKQGEVFYVAMKDMMDTMRVMGVMLVFFILLQMMKIMTDRAKRNISLFKVFGYREGEIWRLYLLPQWIIFVLGIALMLPLAKKSMDFMYPFMVANVPWGMVVEYPLTTYLRLFTALTATSLVIMTIFIFRIRKFEAGEILKYRE